MPKVYILALPFYCALVAFRAGFLAALVVFAGAFLAAFAVLRPLAFPAGAFVAGRFAPVSSRLRILTSTFFTLGNFSSIYEKIVMRFLNTRGSFARRRFVPTPRRRDSFAHPRPPLSHARSVKDHHPCF